MIEFVLAVLSFSLGAVLGRTSIIRPFYTMSEDEDPNFKVVR